MDRHEGTHHPKHPPQGLFAPHGSDSHGFALWVTVGTLVTVVMLVGVVLLFWNVAHPGLVQQTSKDSYSIEGGHDPNPRARNIRDELRFRGALTPPPEVRGR